MTASPRRSTRTTCAPTSTPPRRRCESALLALVCKFSRWRAIEDRHYLDRQELQRDVLRIRVFYYKRGFREAEVDTAVTQLNEKQVEVRFDDP